MDKVTDFLLFLGKLLIVGLVGESCFSCLNFCIDHTQYSRLEKHSLKKKCAIICKLPERLFCIQVLR